ncbi:hypothetical protein H4N58_18245 [Mumia sp. ZJ1417]|uniref:hypothetical protein n=1 Tax=unclassified Mumia TaxID=2621872 RepID=UPI0014211573|nr:MULTISPECIES: hypothetical protein [unclassified Mumia]QMW66058.1 hypothetical protein H4N58_18245 [Mumia sp. ZJ1417]
MSTKERTPWPMMAGLVTTTGAAAITLLLSGTGLPDVLVVPVLVVLLATMVGGLVADFLVRRDERRTIATQRRWLAGLGKDLPTYRHRVDDRERVLFSWESSWYQPLGTLFLVALAAALVPFNLILPLAPRAGVEALVTAWVAASLLLTGALVVRTVAAARKDSRGLLLPGPAVPWTPASPVAPRDPAKLAAEENAARYLVVEEDASPQEHLSREIERMTSILDSPEAPQPVLPVPADWMPRPPAPPEAPEATKPEPEQPSTPSTPETPPAPPTEDRPEGELDKLARLFHSAA